MYDGQYFKGYIFLLHSNQTSNTGIVAQIDNDFTRKASLIYDGTGFSCTTAQIEDIVYFKVRKYKNNGPIMAYGLTYERPTNMSSSDIIDTLFGNFNLDRRFNNHMGSTNHCQDLEGTAHSKYHFDGIAPAPNTREFMGKTYTLQNWKNSDNSPISLYSLETVPPHSEWYLDIRRESDNAMRIISISLFDNH